MDNRTDAQKQYDDAVISLLESHIKAYDLQRDLDAWLPVFLDLITLFAFLESILRDKGANVYESEPAYTRSLPHPFVDYGSDVSFVTRDPILPYTSPQGIIISVPFVGYGFLVRGIEHEIYLSISHRAKKLAWWI